MLSIIHHTVRSDIDCEALAKESYVVQDIIPEIHFYTREIIDVLEIDSIYLPADERNKGAGFRELKDFCDRNSDKIIVLKAGPHKLDFPTKPDDETILKVLDDLNRFYTRVGFVDVNDELDCYEWEARAYVYCNEKSKPLLELLKKRSLPAEI